MKYEGVSFNEKWISSLPNEEAFINEFTGEGYKHIFENDPNRENKLKEVYAFAAKKDEPVAVKEKVAAAPSKSKKVPVKANGQ